jgi:long-subunit acyl-CoA synthetase (AMP-forming)
MTFILKEGSGDESVIADHFLPDIVSGSGMLPAGALNIHTEDTVVILYTTGTTGPRKGVMLSHGNLQAAVKNINTFMGFTDDIIESLPMRSFSFIRFLPG